MRWIPVNRQRRLEPWMYTRPGARHRVLITSGTRAPMLRAPGGSMRPLADRLALASARWRARPRSRCPPAVMGDSGDLPEQTPLVHIFDHQAARLAAGQSQAGPKSTAERDRDTEQPSPG